MAGQPHRVELEHPLEVLALLRGDREVDELLEPRETLHIVELLARDDLLEDLEGEGGRQPERAESEVRRVLVRGRGEPRQHLVEKAERVAGKARCLDQTGEAPPAVTVAQQVDQRAVYERLLGIELQELDHRVAHPDEVDGGAMARGHELDGAGDGPGLHGHLQPIRAGKARTGLSPHPTKARLAGGRGLETGDDDAAEGGDLRRNAPGKPTRAVRPGQRPR